MNVRTIPPMEQLLVSRGKIYELQEISIMIKTNVLAVTIYSYTRPLHTRIRSIDTCGMCGIRERVHTVNEYRSHPMPINWYSRQWSHLLEFTQSFGGQPIREQSASVRKVFLVCLPCGFTTLSYSILKNIVLKRDNVFDARMLTGVARLIWLGGDFKTAKFV